ncbi:IQ and ubiquitin-like domain-containing protein isoform X1 [Anguilla anguilla]|uniref:IQ and ubiquitin-like domain-containing protein isoform X1 n=1 Tax=Anguilla anguilla TaxID=7936 RepID=UPI0015AF11DE|nr:IQ and ubiquitin-like domain-containing protein isoform X1 [Anguilla anguilla]
MSEKGSELSDIVNEKRAVDAQQASTLEAGDHVENLEETSETQPGATEPETHLEALQINNSEETDPDQVADVCSETFYPIGDKENGTVNHSEEKSVAPVEVYDSDQGDVNSQGKTVHKKTTFAPDVGNSTATVKMLLPEGHVMTLAFAIGFTIQDLKNHFANELKISSDIIQVSLDGSAVTDRDTLVDLGVQPHGTIQLEMSSIDPENHPIRPVKLQTEYNMPDVITVRVQAGTDAYQDVVVEIERATQRKTFLGGYRHKVTGTEFHHCAVQTVAKRPPGKGLETFCRDTQTVEVKSQAQQCSSTTATQMSKIGCHVSNMEDKLVPPGPYVTADECAFQKWKAIIVLQKYARRWLAKSQIHQLRHEKQERLDWLEREHARKLRDKEKQMEAEYRRRMNPQTKEDFALLYSALERWRKEEVERINATHAGAKRKGALCTLLNEETQHIASIGQHRLVAAKKNEEKAVQTLLEKCAAPKAWKSFDGKVTAMDTQNTIRARELQELYVSLSAQYRSPDDRLAVLQSLRDTVKEQDCKLTREIMDLICREADLMTREVKSANLEGLRKRISTLFLQYIKTPAFNPEVTRLLKVPPNAGQKRRKIYRCKACNSYLPCTGFSLSIGSSQMARCHRCMELDNEARHREDASLYRDILLHLRRAEAERHPQAKIIYLLQEQDLRYLVDVIWGAQSALSACDDLRDLVMVRWDRAEEWSPWNCVLLNKDEAPAHLKMESVREAYGTSFIRSVQHKHMLARNYFSEIPAMADRFDSTGCLPAAQSSAPASKPVSTATE